MKDRTRLLRVMGRPCSVPGCGRKSSGARRLCDSHATHRKRHGHELQEGVRVGEITETKKFIRRWIRSRANGDRIWQGILADWQKCRDDALAEMRAVNQPGRVGRSWLMSAWRDIINVGSSADAEKIILTVMAVVWLREYQPRRFVDDTALLYQISRRFRTLSEHNVCTWENSSQGEPRRCYRTPAPRHAHALGGMLLARIGVHAIAIHNKWSTERAEAQARRQKTLSAIAESEDPQGVTPEDGLININKEN